MYNFQIIFQSRNFSIPLIIPYILNNLTSIIENHSICEYCILRVITKDNQRITKKEIDESQKLNLVESIKCIFCKGSIEKSMGIIDRLINKIQEIEFSSFLVGVKLSNELKDLDLFFSNYGIKVLSLKQAIAREFSEVIISKLLKTVKSDKPDLSIIIELRGSPRYELQISSLFILGKYLKMERGIPQTKWPCTYCKGKGNGCISCAYSGQQYPNSVEKIISDPFKKFTGSNNSSFHGAGREDIDALMLGTGRPFVLEIKSPKTRKIDLGKVVKIINRSKSVNVTDMQFCEKSVIKKLKSESSIASKSYRALVHFQNTANQEQIDILRKLENEVILLNQRTPIRVSHRRADLIRKKKIYSVKIGEIIDGNNIYLMIEAQGGAYIKEFISGDNGRTTPSISELLGNSAVCTALDVIKVDDKGIF